MRDRTRCSVNVPKPRVPGHAVCTAPGETVQEYALCIGLIHVNWMPPRLLLPRHDMPQPSQSVAIAVTGFTLRVLKRRSVTALPSSKMDFGLSKAAADSSSTRVPDEGAIDSAPKQYCSGVSCTSRSPIVAAECDISNHILGEEVSAG